MSQPEKMTVKKAARILGMTEQTVRLLMDEGAIDLGYVIKEDRERKRYVIMPELLRKEAERVGAYSIT